MTSNAPADDPTANDGDKPVGVAPSEVAKASSAIRVLDAWYVLCESGELKDGPLARKLYGTPLVVFRGAAGKPGVLLDRCAHRNVPLSLGRLNAQNLECPYHGWQYDNGGNCRKIPSYCGKAELPKRAVPMHAAVEQDGFIWAYARPNVTPDSFPRPLKTPSGRGYVTVRRQVEAKATLHATVENALDVPHTAFLHRGLFRGSGKTNRIKAVVTRPRDGVQTEYIGEPRPEGVVGTILSPSGGIVTHFDRFFLPSTAEVEYRIGDENHIFVQSIATPVEDFVTKMYAVVSFRTRLPGALLKRVLDPLAMKIFGQDQRVLKLQSESIHRFGGENYTSTEIDLMGPQILRLLKRAARGAAAKETDNDWRIEIELEV